MGDRQATTDRVWLSADTCSVGELRTAVERTTEPRDYPFAEEISRNVPIYDADAIRTAFDRPEKIKAYMAEWNRALGPGPGIIAFRNAIPDRTLIDDVSEILNKIIEDERASSSGSGDHFAPAGKNSRVWNSHEKLCIASPELFARYNANHIVPLASRSWLGPNYQITAQVNVVRPGGQAQVCHRDYHMGFQTAEALAQYPASVHALSPALTLQGAIAHVDMPVDSGPTKLLPYSQTYLPGYLATTRSDIRAYFEEHAVQLPLAKGDALFFNPAVFHAAGENRSADIDRLANLMQIGSGYGRSIEIVDRTRMCHALYQTLSDLKQAGSLTEHEINNVIEASAEGYPFPANLDIDSPLSGMAPPSQQDVMRQALAEGWDKAAFGKAIDEQQGRKRSH
ncbi:MAG: phytanoyl-CoA dioxygenase family protein [Pseudomonadota bacterium]